MEPLQPPSWRGARLAFVGVALLVLLGIVAFASRSGLGHSSKAEPSPGYVSYAFTAFLILFVLAIPVAIWALWVEKASIGFDRPTFRRAVLQNLGTFALLCVIVGGALYLRSHHGFIRHPNAAAIRHAKQGMTKDQVPKKTVEPSFKWPVLWIALGVLGVASVPAVRGYRRNLARRRARALRAPLSVSQDLAASLTDAIDDLEAEPDARTAVIAAYARMERVFARHGLRRRASETSLEYLRRILLGLTGRADAVRRLTSLFEQAKFSRHEIDGSMKQEAIGALREIREDLQEAPA
jgi:hypothetical protein